VSRPGTPSVWRMTLPADAQFSQSVFTRILALFRFCSDFFNFFLSDSSCKFFLKRLDYGKKYCHSSPTLDETRIQAAIVNAIQKFAQQDTQLFKNLKSHIERGINDVLREDDSLDIQLRLAAVEKEINV